MGVYAWGVRLARLLRSFAALVVLVGACGAPIESTPDTTLADPPTRMLVAVGAMFACAARVGGQVACWGGGSPGQSSCTKQGCVALPTLVSGVDNVAELVASGAGNSSRAGHACARTQTGEVYCWGPNRCGESAPDVNADYVGPTRVADVDGARRIAVAAERSCALRGDGRVVCWGDGCEGKGTRPATVVEGIEDVVELSRGSDDHFCALRADGSAVCWGENYWGQLGAGDREAHAAPVVVAGVAKAIRVAVSDGHSSVLLADGTVLCWGDCGSRVTPVPVPVPNMAHTVDLGTGLDLANCIRRPEGHVQCACVTASASHMACDFAFRDVPPLDHVTVVSSAFENACAAEADDSVLCWGAGANGELGDGVKHDPFTPGGPDLSVGPFRVSSSL